MLQNLHYLFRILTEVTEFNFVNEQSNEHMLIEQWNGIIEIVRSEAFRSKRLSHSSAEFRKLTPGRNFLPNSLRQSIWRPFNFYA